MNDEGRGMRDETERLETWNLRLENDRRGMRPACLESEIVRRAVVSRPCRNLSAEAAVFACPESPSFVPRASSFILPPSSFLLDNPSTLEYITV
jgi:hypothetical protein